MNEKKIEFMNEKKWNDFDVRPSKIFGYEVQDIDIVIVVELVL